VSNLIPYATGLAIGLGLGFMWGSMHAVKKIQRGQR
jgi:hypothetical protein